MTDKDLEARLKFKTDQQSANQAKDAVGGVEKKTKDATKAAEELAKAAKKASDQFRQMKEAGDKLKGIGQGMMLAGGAILGPLGLAAKAYLDQAKGATEESKRWNDAMLKIQEATAKIGEVVVKEVLPYLEKGAEIFGKVADFLQQNPDFVKMALIGGGALVAAGTVVSAVGSIVSVVGTLGQIAGFISGGGALSGVAGSLGTLVATTGPLFLLIAALGALTYLIQSGKAEQASTTASQLPAVIAQQVVSKLFGEQAGNWAFAMAGRYTGAIDADTYAKMIRNMRGGRLNGGYVNRGIYPLAEDGRREFVLNNPMTRKMEALVGGQITNQRLTSMASNVRATINGDLSASARAGLRREVRGIFDREFRSAFRG